MEEEELVDTQRDTQSLIPATQDTASLEATPECVSLMEYGHRVCQHA